MLVIKQPDGLYAVWSPIVDDFIVFDATADDIDTYIVERAIEKAQKEAASLIAQAHLLPETALTSRIEQRNTLHGPLDVEHFPDEEEYIEWLNRMTQNQPK